MIISVNWLKQFVSIDLPIDELSTLIGARLVEIEDIIDLGARYRDATVVRIISCDPLPGSDHLHVLKIDDGGRIKDVPREANGTVQVVCGAPNVREDLLVVWLPPGSLIPETFGHDEVKLDARPIMGVLSQGMIASAKELALFDDNGGILELDNDLTPGQSFADAYELDDYLLDIENKSLTHRPDAFGIVGFAREVAAIQGKQFTTPDWLSRSAASEIGVPETVRVLPTPVVDIADPALCARYQAAVLTGVSGDESSPLKLRTYLARSGVRPINAVVDVTNYLMLLTGQPLHAFDYDKFAALAGGRPEINVRLARAGETLDLLDGRTIELDDADIVIAAGDVPAGLAGAMGGAATEIDEHTRAIMLESATFNLYNLRSTQMRHGIFSEAVTRFTKGQPAQLTDPVIKKAVAMLSDFTGASLAAPIVDNYPEPAMAPVIAMNTDAVNATLGTDYSGEDMRQTLTRAEFVVNSVGATTDFSVVVPYWRPDVRLREDVIEEIGRLRGYETIQPVVPLRPMKAVEKNELQVGSETIRELLSAAGANEVLSYSFVPESVLSNAGLNPGNSYKIINSLSPDLQYYRQTLLPSLMTIARTNIKGGYERFALYEINKVHAVSFGQNDEGVPVERHSLGFLFYDKHVRGAAYYTPRHFLDFMADKLNVTLDYQVLDGQDGGLDAVPFEPVRSAVVTSEGRRIGVVGELKAEVRKAFKLPETVAGFEIDPAAFLASGQPESRRYRSLSRFPSITRDVCFQVPVATPYQTIVQSARSADMPEGITCDVGFVDVYSNGQTESKNVTLRVTFTPWRKTLTGDEAAAMLQDMIGAVTKATGAEVI